MHAHARLQHQQAYPVQCDQAVAQCSSYAYSCTGTGRRSVMPLHALGNIASCNRFQSNGQSGATSSIAATHAVLTKSSALLPCRRHPHREMAAVHSITLSLVLWLSVLAVAVSSASVLQHPHQRSGGSQGSCPSCQALFPQGQPAPIPGDFNFYFLVRCALHLGSSQRGFTIRAKPCCQRARHTVPAATREAAQRLLSVARGATGSGQMSSASSKSPTSATSIPAPGKQCSRPPVRLPAHACLGKLRRWASARAIRVQYLGDLQADTQLVFMCNSEQCKHALGVQTYKLLLCTHADNMWSWATAQPWPASVTHAEHTACLTTHACRNGFTLHGLWPNLDNACREDFPEHCIARSSSFEPLDMGSLNQTVLYGLQNSWISYTSCARTTLTLHAPCLVQAACFITLALAPCARCDTVGTRSRPRS